MSRDGITGGIREARNTRRRIRRIQRIHRIRRIHRNWILLATSCALALSSCGSPDGSGEKQSKKAENYFRELRSTQNGLYYHPFLRTKPAGTEAQSYALKVLAETGRKGREPKISLDAEEQKTLHDDAVATSPLWGRYWLIPFRQADAAKVLGKQDGAAVRKLRTRDGTYADPGIDGQDDATLLGSTWTAVEVLHAVGELDALSPAETAATARWLTRLAGRTHDLSAAGALARTLRLLSQPVPAALTRQKAPPMDDFTSLTPDKRVDRLSDTYGYVQVQEAAGRRPALDAAAWRTVLEHNADALDYEQLYYAAHILHATGAGPDVYRDARRRLERNRLPDGTIRDPDAYAGSLDASLWVERLRALAGWSLDDGGLVTALGHTAEAADHSPEGSELRTRAALYRQAGAADAARDASSDSCADGQTLPPTVTERSAVPWQRTALECAEAGADVPAPKVRRWQLSTPQQVASAAALTVGLHDTRSGKGVPSWITADALASWARNPHRFTSVHDYAQVVRAYLALGGRATGAVRSAMRQGITPYKGCPGMPDLYRIGGPDPGCDLKTTWAVWALDRQAPGVLKALPKGAATEPADRR